MVSLQEFAARDSRGEQGRAHATGTTLLQLLLVQR